MLILLLTNFFHSVPKPCDRSILFSILIEVLYIYYSHLLNNHQLPCLIIFLFYYYQAPFIHFATPRHTSYLNYLSSSVIQDDNRGAGSLDLSVGHLDPASLQEQLFSDVGN